MSRPVLVTCPSCEEQTLVTATTDSGATDWSPEECRACKQPFPDDAPWVDTEPDDPW